MRAASPSEDDVVLFDRISSWPVGTQFEIRWLLEDVERSIGESGGEDLIGLGPGSLADLAPLFPSDTRLAVERSGIGKGASGDAFALLVISERVVGDLAGLIAIGTAIRGAIRKIGQRRRTRPIVEDDLTLAAITASENEPFLVGRRYLGVIPISAQRGVGTDDRDIWAVMFGDEDAGSIALVFMSPSLLRLGYIDVPYETYWNGSTHISRDAAAIKAWRARHRKS